MLSINGQCQTISKVISCLITTLFFIAIMRSFSLLQDAIVPYIPTLIGQLTHKLLAVSKVIHTWKLFMGTSRFYQDAYLMDTCQLF